MKLLFTFCFLITGVLVFSTTAFGQEKPPVPIKVIPVKPKQADSILYHIDTTTTIKKGVKQRDLADVIYGLFNLEPSKEPDTVTSKPSFSIVPAFGYTLVSRLALVLSGNCAFRTGPNSRISTIAASSSITQNKQITLPILTNIWSKTNDWNFVGDYRIYKYPQSTFGLGSSSNIADEDPLQNSYLQLKETVLRHVAGNIYLGLGYVIDDHWDVSEKGDLNGTVSDYSRYGATSHSIASGFTFNGLLDSRDNGINPSKGAYVWFEYRDNYSFLGSTSSWRSVIVDVRKYFKFPEGSDNVIALWSYDWLTLSGKPAYLDLPSTQWDASSSTGRGYIQGRFRGAEMVYLEAEYRYRITDDGLIGGVVFINGQSFSAAPGTKLQSIQPAFGPGLRIKLNTISKTNIGIDYGFGRQGSNGLFIDVGEYF